jgi:hypothetical protein
MATQYKGKILSYAVTPLSGAYSQIKLLISIPGLNTDIELIEEDTCSSLEMKYPFIKKEFGYNSPNTRGRPCIVELDDTGNFHFVAYLTLSVGTL